MKLECLIDLLEKKEIAIKLDEGYDKEYPVGSFCEVYELTFDSVYHKIKEIATYDEERYSIISGKGIPSVIIFDKEKFAEILELHSNSDEVFLYPVPKTTYLDNCKIEAIFNNHPRYKIEKISSSNNFIRVKDMKRIKDRIERERNEEKEILNFMDQLV